MWISGPTEGWENIFLLLQSTSNPESVSLVLNIPLNVFRLSVSSQELWAEIYLLQEEDAIILGSLGNSSCLSVGYWRDANWMKWCRRRRRIWEVCGYCQDLFSSLSLLFIHTETSQCSCTIFLDFCVGDRWRRLGLKNKVSTHLSHR